MGICPSNRPFCASNDVSTSWTRAVCDSRTKGVAIGLQPTGSNLLKADRYRNQRFLSIPRVVIRKDRNVKGYITWLIVYVTIYMVVVLSVAVVLAIILHNLLSLI